MGTINQYSTIQPIGGSLKLFSKVLLFINSMRVRFFVLTLTMLLLASVIPLLFLLRSERECNRTFVLRRLSSIISGLNKYDLHTLATGSAAEIERVFAPLRQYGMASTLTVYDADGSVVYSTNASQCMQPSSVKNSIRSKRSNSRIHGSRIFASAVLSGVRGRKRLMETGFPLTEYNLIWLEMGHNFIVFCILIFFFGVCASIFLNFRIFRPLEKVSSEISRVAAGDYSRNITYPSLDEIGVLARSFNHMVGKLKTAMEKNARHKQELEETVERVTRKLTEKQKELIHKEKLASIGQLTAGIAHEINNPLSGILMQIQLFKESVSDDQSKVNLTETEAEIKRCRNIIHNLLLFSRKDSSKKELFSFTPYIRDTITSLQRGSFSEYSDTVSIELSLCSEEPKVLLNSDEMRQVIRNLLTNAAQAMNGKGKIRIQTRTTETHCILTVEDNGPGIAENNIDNIFDPFFTSKKAGHGTGLGLSVSYGIVQGHSGSISAANRSDGGTVFTVKLNRVT